LLIPDKGFGIIAKVAGSLAAAESEASAMGRGQVARHRVLVPGSQVRILPPQPVVSGGNPGASMS
jgi:hypothetical protein